MIVYLDVCALKRPFDDAHNERVRREADGVARIFEEVESGRPQLVVSPAHEFENDRNPREDRRLATALWLRNAQRSVDVSADVEERARLLNGLGFKPLDALRLALAEKAQARWFVTTDDQLLRKSRALRDEMRVEIVTPDQFMLNEDSSR